VKTQILRAIGNMFYYNDTGRETYLQTCGIELLIRTCKYAAQIDYKNCSDEEKEENNVLIAVLLGCLHNLTNENGE
jgi:hypothetical protein